MKKIIILGSTGSIGTQALDIVRRHPDRFQVEGLAGGTNISLLQKQIAEFKPALVSVIKQEDAKKLKGKVFWGEEGVVEMVASSKAPLVVSAIVGAAGLKPTFQALRMGKKVALANKESLVIAGQVMTDEAKRSGAEILPVDSEHSAIFQSLASGKREEVKKIILTASGGPFFKRARESLQQVTVEEALKHPNWDMGAKITIDSATLMNKGLEIIEARWLFDFSAEMIDVVIHPQSIVHSMVEFLDGSVIAQMGTPDMRCAISYALAYPNRIESGVKSLSLPKLENLSFYQPDFEKFPCLRLGWEVARDGGSRPAVLNAANEIAVDRFLNKKISFTEIPKLISKTLNKHQPVALKTIDDVIEVDRWAREETASL